jgi:hypothetical protein
MTSREILACQVKLGFLFFGVFLPVSLPSNPFGFTVLEESKGIVARGVRERVRTVPLLCSRINRRRVAA